MQEIVYTEEELNPREIPVSIGKEKYTLREASGEAAIRYRNACLACTTLGESGSPQTIRNLANVEPLLVHLCLWEKDAQGNERNVPESKIRAMPNRIQKDLFQTAKEISHLVEDSREVDQLGKALAVYGGPVKMKDLREFINSLPSGRDYSAVKLMFKESEEEHGKN